MMLPDFRLIKRHRLWRMTHIVGAAFVLFYVFFQVLDLDLSGFPLKEASEERTVVLTEASETTELTNTISGDSLRVAVMELQLSLKGSIAFQQQNFLRPTRPREVRIQLHRLKIPRSPAAESSPAA